MASGECSLFHYKIGGFMGLHEWFRRITWTHKDQEEFFARLNRSRGASSKAQYARIQAFHLEETNEPELVKAALDLLNLVLVKWPEAGEIAQVNNQLASCQIRLGNTHQAVEHFQQSLRAEKEHPGVQTGTRIDFPWFIAMEKLVQFYPQAHELFELAKDYSDFPIHRFLVFGASAFILADEGQQQLACQRAIEALRAASLTDSGYRYHKQLGLVGNRYQREIGCLKRIAGSES